MPQILDVMMDKRSTITYEEFPALIEQIYNFAHVNWRGFNAATIPATLNYSKLIANTIVSIGANNWNQIVTSGKLGDKSWFL